MPRFRTAFGFTLVELMVVLALIGIMTAVILPEMRGTYEDALLRSTSRKLVGVLNLAYSQAITLSQLHRVRLDPKQGRFVLERTAQSDEQGLGFVPARGVPGSEGELDTRISIEVRKPDQETAAEPLSRTSRDDSDRAPRIETISFYPDGTADAGEILLQDSEGFRLVLRINPITARVQVVELARE